jgi:O-acetyl-ADP-ribose deacetylase (regulator of RNase III)
VIRVVVDDLASVESDAVVRPATTSLEPAAPALDRLERIAGPAVRPQLSPGTRLGVGAAVVTGGGNLPAELVIHAVIVGDDQPVTAAGIRQTVTSLIQRAVDWELARIATPLLGAGPGQLPLDDAARILVDALAGDLSHTTYPREVCIVVGSEEEREIVDAFIRGRLTT